VPLPNSSTQRLANLARADYPYACMTPGSDQTRPSPHLISSIVKRTLFGMRQDRPSSFVAIAIVAVSMFAGIASAAGATDGSPSWVSRGNGAMSNPNDMYRALHVVGMARPGAGVDARTLRNKALDNAKQEVERALQALAATVAKNGGDGSGFVAPGLQGINAAAAGSKRFKAAFFPPRFTERRF
jgi:hypothetical protein